MKTVMLSLTILSLASFSILNELRTASTSASDTSNQVSLYGFPQDLYCADVVEGNGPSWESITIGSSTLAELAELLFQKSDEFDVFSEGNEVRFSIFDSTSIRDKNIPTTVKACVVDDIVMALAVRQNLSDLPKLEDYIFQFGEPNAVAWSDSETSRVIFWFEQGIAADVGVTDSGFGMITSSVYMPYQPSTDFETRWPYNRTRTMPPLAGDYGFEPPLPTEQNPFDFDAIIATITAQPSRTPTPTLTPAATTTP